MLEIEAICLFDVLCKETCDCVWLGGNVAILASTYLTLQLKYTRCPRFSSNPNKELNLYSLFQIPNLLMWETHPVAGAHTSAALEKNQPSPLHTSWCMMRSLKYARWALMHAYAYRNKHAERCHPEFPALLLRVWGSCRGCYRTRCVSQTKAGTSVCLCEGTREHA